VSSAVLNRYYSGDQMKNEMGGACGMNGGEHRCIDGSVGKPAVKRPLGRARLIWNDNIKIDLQEV
jgi:hypothetical protein